MLTPLLLLALAGAPAPKPPTVESIVKAVVQAYGGEKAIKTSAAGKVRARVESRMRRETGDETREWSLPGRLRVELAYPSATEVRLLDGEQGWRGDKGALTPVSGPPRDAMLFQLLRLNPAWVLSEYRGRLTLGPVREIDQLRYQVLQLAWSESVSVNYLVNPANNRVTRVEGAVNAGGMSIAFGTAYDDFRVVDGVLVAFHEHNFASGTLTGSTVVSSVEFGARAVEGRFKP